MRYSCDKSNQIKSFYFESETNQTDNISLWLVGDCDVVLNSGRLVRKSIVYNDIIFVALYYAFLLLLSKVCIQNQDLFNNTGYGQYRYRLRHSTVSTA